MNQAVLESISRIIWPKIKQENQKMRCSEVHLTRTLETEVQNCLDPKKKILLDPKDFGPKKYFWAQNLLGSKLTLSLAQLSPSLFGM